MDTADIVERVGELATEADPGLRVRRRIRDILSGGLPAAQAILGPDVQDEDIPLVNLMLSGLEQMALEVARRPRVRVDVPPSVNGSERQRKRAEKRERILESYDEADNMELALYQAARWIIAYGYAPWVVSMRKATNPDGSVVLRPRAELRDPIDCYVGDWGPRFDPQDMAVVRRIHPRKLAKIYPQHADAISRLSAPFRSTWSGASYSTPGRWENQSGRGVAIAEYYDREGTWVVLPGAGILLDHSPNPLTSGPPFVVPRRITSGELSGQYDHIIGLLVAMVKINALSIIAMEDSVFSEIDVIGDPPLNGAYKIGRGEVNFLSPGTQVVRPVANLPYQLFDLVNRIERQARVVAGYPVTDDGQSPMSFVTGQGLDELGSAKGRRTKEYQTIIRHALTALDAKRLEADDLSPDRTKPKRMEGIREGITFDETYTPAVDIAGSYRSRRVYGVLSGFDEPTKLIAGMQMVDAGILDPLTLQEEIDGLENLTVVNDRIVDNRVRTALLAGLSASASPDNPDSADRERAIAAMIDMLPPSDLKTRLAAFYAPPEDEEAMPPDMAAMLGPMGGGAPGAPPPDVTTVLRRLSAPGGMGGIQTVSRT